MALSPGTLTLAVAMAIPPIPSTPPTTVNTMPPASQLRAFFASGLSTSGS